MVNEIEALQWYADMGVDEVVGNTPINRYEQSEPKTSLPETQSLKKQPQATATVPASVAPDKSVSDATKIAARCQNLDELREAIENFECCALKNTAKNTVFADGNPEAPVMFVGEAPGRDEDIQGLPFVGAAGQLLDQILKSIGRDRESVYISNILNWRPPGNRTPTPHEALTCLPFIRRHIQLVDPKCVVMLGGTSAKHLLDTTTGVMRLRGKWTKITLDPQTGQTIEALPTLHPAYLLRQPAHKRLVWQDFLSLKSKLEGDL